MKDRTTLYIETITSSPNPALLPSLTYLLQDTVHNGASIGFLSPLSKEEAQHYWQGVFAEVTREACFLLIARIGKTIVGTVQLAPSTKPNGSHRAEVQKLMVLQSHRKQGIARQLMTTIEQVARDHKRTLLVLDTRLGDTAERLYRNLGYQEVGIIPDYAQNPEGIPEATIYFYKQLSL